MSESVMESDCIDAALTSDVRSASLGIGRITCDCRLPVDENVLVLGRQERQVPELLQRRVLAPNPIQQRDLVRDVPLRRPVADADLVLLGVEVLLAPRL